MLIEFMDKQPIAYNLMVSEIKKNHISHAYLIDENNCDYSYELVLSFVKEILTYGLQEEDKIKLIKRIDDGNYPEIKVISPDGMLIKKQQILDLQFEFSKVAIEGSKRVYIIKDADKMRSEAANSMLKFLEEPENDVIAILMTNNYNNMLSTIISRCQVIRLNNDNNSLNYNDELCDVCFNFISNIEFNGIKMISNLQNIIYDNISIKDREKIVVFFDKIIDMYYDILKIKIGKSVDINSEWYDTFAKIANNNSESELLSKINKLILSKDTIRNNVNVGLLIDSLIISWRKI